MKSLKINQSRFFLSLFSQARRINFFWAVLISLTLFATFIAEEASPGNITVLLICFTISVKGHIIIDEFMGLREAIPIIRYTIHSYFVLLPLFIAFTIIFPEILVKFTSIV
jgi:hypothetical protein